MTLLVIGIDPSLTATGIAAVDFDAGKILDWRCLRTKPDAKFKATEDLARRLQEIAAGIRLFMAEHSGLVVVEGQVGASFAGSSLASNFLLGAGYGAVMGALNVKPIVLHSATIKARVLGNREKTTKTAAWEAVQKHFVELPKDPSNKPSREAVHDAVITACAALPEIQQLLSMRPRVV